MEEKFFNQGESEEDKSAEIKINEIDSLQERKEKVSNFFKKNYNWLTYLILAVIVYISVKIRASNLSGLRDITTGGWTLGPDLDPFLFLRWAKYIVENGTLFSIDQMRYVPLGIETKSELLLHPYMIAWFHKLAAIFGSGSVEQSAAIYPVFFFAITVIAFFFLVRAIFINSLGEKQSNIIALISSFFLTVIPSLLPRTIAGIPEKESAAFFFLFLSFFLFISAWRAHKFKNQIILSILAALSTVGMALVWGGFAFIFLILAIVIFLTFFLGQFDKRRFCIYTIWFFTSVILMSPFSSRYYFPGLFSSIIILIPGTIICTTLIYSLLSHEKLNNKIKNSILSKMSLRILSFLITLLLGVIAVSIFFGPTFLFDKINGITGMLVNPITDRLGMTVAENRQPFFSEWANNFGPIIRGIPLFFWLFFIGSVYLFYKTVKHFRKKEKLILTGSYLFFLTAIVFSRYSPDSILNGTNSISLTFYALGLLVLIGSSGYVYYKSYKSDDLEKMKKIDFGYLFLLTFFIFSIISARGAVRLVLFLVPPSSIIVSYFVTSLFFKAKKAKTNRLKIFFGILAVITIILTAYSGIQFYKDTYGQAQFYAPSIYNHQWQKAMFWVRENTPKNAVFGHWWDYGYWVQSIGERATVLDGGNIIAYWNYFMGRHALTGTDNRKALEFLYAHNATHFLIDPTDIGKYGAFSSIGSDESYDRASQIPIFQRNGGQTTQVEGAIINIYEGALPLESTINYDLDGTRITLPSGSSFLAGIIISRDIETEKISEQPKGVFISQSTSQQIVLPLKYSFDEEFKDYGSGIPIGFYLIPRIGGDTSSMQVEKNGAMFVFSERTVKSQLARLYIYEEENPNFKLVHSEDDFFVAQVKSQLQNFDSDFLIYQGGLRGPIRIWEINYPQNIELKEEYLETKYIDSLQK